ncbi:GntR family transcriptional regulator [Aquiflexum sp.]|uniref:GntR family transcriptional regulator n=1 Tax=Aquiflexum sp. TaxID=1872584 RepID=UPI0035939A09
MLTKHQQLINLITDDIARGKYKTGERIPSINETSFYYLLSKDTVEKAYNELKEKGILTSVRGKGFYVSLAKGNSSRSKALLLFNKLNPYKRAIYYSIINTVKHHAVIDIHIHHCNLRIFEELLNENLDKYDHYVVAPHFFDTNFNSVDGYELIQRIPKEKVIIVDRQVVNHEQAYPGIYQDFEQDIFLSLYNALSLLKKYETIKLVFPKDRMYPPEMITGFKKFTFINEFKNLVIDGIDDDEILVVGEVYIVIAETDLISIVKKCREQKLKLGQDIGLIAFNDTPLKEILEEGITTISTDFNFMGEFIGKLITGEESIQLAKRPSRLIKRNSL